MRLTAKLQPLALALVAAGVVLLVGAAHTERPDVGKSCLITPKINDDPANDSEYIADILRKALDEALKSHVQHMFETWMKDNTDQPHRADVGTRNAIAAYRKACEKINEAIWQGSIPAGSEQ